MSPSAWEFFYELIKDDLKCKADIIIAISHWFLMDRTNLRCLGLGEEKALRANEGSNGVVFLPNNRNKDSFNYSLRYVLDGKVYKQLQRKIYSFSLFVSPSPGTTTV